RSGRKGIVIRPRFKKRARSSLMYQVSIYRRATGPRTFAVTPDPTGSVLPDDPSRWQLHLRQMVHPEQATEGSELKCWERAFFR
ncbi:MAG TPA: hypothetical protein VG815_02980, partial [Chloroflexota bacterium]|nr:hypothetical protein [Chloroflexota bacterium]